MNRIKVELEQQVVDFIRSLTPEPRHALRRGIKSLEQEKGDIRWLGFNPLRAHRVSLQKLLKAVLLFEISGKGWTNSPNAIKIAR